MGMWECLDHISSTVFWGTRIGHVAMKKKSAGETAKAANAMLVVTADGL
jgi:hypothetical protein